MAVVVVAHDQREPVTFGGSVTSICLEGKMVDLKRIMSMSKSDLQEEAKVLQENDLPQLVEWLSLTDDNIRYRAFLLLQGRSLFFSDVYPFWDTFLEKLRSDNSYQRSIGLMLIAENARWDGENCLEAIIDDYLALLKDEKPVTVRQCIQSLGRIAAAKPGLNQKIASALISFDIMAVRETMRKSILRAGDEQSPAIWPG